MSKPKYSSEFEIMIAEVCSGKAQEPEAEEAIEQPKEKCNISGLLIFFVVALLGCGGHSITLSL